MKSEGLKIGVIKIIRKITYVQYNKKLQYIFNFYTKDMMLCLLIFMFLYYLLCKLFGPTNYIFSLKDTVIKTLMVIILSVVAGSYAFNFYKYVIETSSFNSRMRRKFAFVESFLFFPIYCSILVINFYPIRIKAMAIQSLVLFFIWFLFRKTLIKNEIKKVNIIVKNLE